MLIASIIINKICSVIPKMLLLVVVVVLVLFLLLLLLLLLLLILILWQYKRLDSQTKK